MATIKEVAREAGVSVSTVSLAVNRPEAVTPERRQRVWAAVKRLNYMPNPAARVLRGKSQWQTHAVGVVVPLSLDKVSTSSHVYRAIAGIERGLKKLERQLVLETLETEGDQVIAPKMVRDRRVDGVVVISTSLAPMEQALAVLRRAEVPTVSCGYPGEAFDVSSVMADNVSAAVEATRHLLDQGWPRVATITGPLGYPAGRDRLIGYRMALAASGAGAEAVAEGDFSETSGYDAMGRLLEELAPPFGVFVAGDFMARGAYRRLEEAGLAMPGAVGMVGFDDVEYIVGALRPSLSSVWVPWEEIGEEAAHQLVVAPRDRPVEIRITIPGRLRIRESSVRRKEQNHESH